MKNQKYTLKQIREWFRQLEENRYRKRYMVDAKRVHHYVNLGEDTDLPASSSSSFVDESKSPM